MKILIVNTATTRRNGITSVIFNLLESIPKVDLQIRYVAKNQPDEEYRQRIERLGGELVVIPREIKHPLRYVRQLAKAARGCDAIHAHGNSATLVLEMMAAKMAGVPLRIAHSHSSSCSMLMIHKVMGPLFRRLCNGRLACSKVAGKWLFGKRQFDVVNNGVNTETFKFDAEKRASIRKELGLQDSEILVGHVGNFNYAKNHPFICDVFAAYHKLNPNSRLILIGAGETMVDFKSRISSAGIEESVIFTGSVPNAADYISAIDVILMPSIYEGLPLTLVEEQANGLNCLVSDAITRDADLTGNLHYMSLDKGAEEWAKRLSQLAEKTKTESRKKTSAEAIERIKAGGFDIRTEAANLLSYYHTRLEK